MHTLLLLCILPTAGLAAPWAEVSGEPARQTFEVQRRADCAVALKLLQPLPVGSPGERNPALAWSSPIFLSPRT